MKIIDEKVEVKSISVELTMEEVEEAIRAWVMDNWEGSDAALELIERGCNVNFELAMTPSRGTILRPYVKKVVVIASTETAHCT